MDEYCAAQVYEANAGGWRDCGLELPCPKHED